MHEWGAMLMFEPSLGLAECPGKIADVGVFAAISFGASLISRF